MSDKPKKTTALVGPIRPPRNLVRRILRTYGPRPILHVVGARNQDGAFIIRWDGPYDKEGSYLIYDDKGDAFIGILRRNHPLYAVPTPPLYFGRRYYLIHAANA